MQHSKYLLIQEWTIIQLPWQLSTVVLLRVNSDVQHHTERELRFISSRAFGPIRLICCTLNHASNQCLTSGSVTTKFRLSANQNTPSSSMTPCDVLIHLWKMTQNLYKPDFEARLQCCIGASLLNIVTSLHQHKGTKAQQNAGVKCSHLFHININNSTSSKYHHELRTITFGGPTLVCPLCLLSTSLQS